MISFHKPVIKGDKSYVHPPIFEHLGANSYLCCKLRAVYPAKLGAILHIFVP